MSNLLPSSMEVSEKLSGKLDYLSTITLFQIRLHFEWGIAGTLTEGTGCFAEKTERGWDPGRVV